MTQELIERLRRIVGKLRLTPMPIADVIPALQEAADAIERLTAERDGWKQNCNEQIDLMNGIASEKDALKADAEKCRKALSSLVTYGEIGIVDTEKQQLFVEVRKDAIRYGRKVLKAIAKEKQA